MAEVQRVIDAPADRVWAVLADAWLYASWVVGAAHVRDVDQNWPEPGSQLHHSSGLWPVLLKDVTVVDTADPPRSLVLRPRLWPMGRGVITIRLQPMDRQRTSVTIREDFDQGPLRWALVKVNDLLLHRRNAEALRRLDDLAQHR